MEEKLNKHPKHYNIFYGGYQGVSVKAYADLFVRRNALRETKVDVLGPLRALVSLIAIKKIDEVRGVLSADAWSVNEAAKELFGDGGLGSLVSSEGAPIYQTKYNFDALTKEQNSEDVWASSCRVVSLGELESLFEEFKNKLNIVSFIPFTLENAIVDGIDVDNVICKFSEYMQIFWGDKITPSHYAVLTDCIIHAVKALPSHQLTAEEFLETCIKHNVTSPHAWCFEVCRANSFYELAIFDRKTFATWFCGFVTRFLNKAFGEPSST